MTTTQSTEPVRYIPVRVTDVNGSEVADGDVARQILRAALGDDVAVATRTTDGRWNVGPFAEPTHLERTNPAKDVDGWVSGNLPDGTYVLVLHMLSSDRWVVARNEAIPNR